MLLTSEQSQALLEKHDCYVTEVCDKCRQILGPVRFTRRLVRHRRQISGALFFFVPWEYTRTVELRCCSVDQQDHQYCMPSHCENSKHSVSLSLITRSESAASARQAPARSETRRCLATASKMLTSASLVYLSPFRTVRRTTIDLAAWFSFQRAG